MSNSLAKFGELSIRTTSSLEDDSMENDERFSTIDLNGGVNGTNLNGNGNNNVDESNDSIYSGSLGGGVYLSNGSMNNGYTSFGETSIANNANFINKINTNEMHHTINKSNGNGIASSNGLYDGLNGQNYPSLSDSISNQSIRDSLTNAGDASSKLVLKTANTLETIKQWSKSAYKCTRQIVSEKLGKTQRTFDPELEATIEHLRDLKKKYENILGLSSSLSTYFNYIVNTQKQLGDSFADLAQKSPELSDEFSANAETQKNLAKHADTLIRGINYFVSNLNTLCTKTIEDTLITIRNYEAARLEYDANRFDLEQMQTTIKSEQKPQQISTLEQELARYKEKYEKLKNDVSIKMKFLDENRVKVMKKQLTLFHNSIAAYFSGNQPELEASMKQLNISQESHNRSTNESSHKFESFLEEN